ncbi:unnamed protein product [Brassica rapa subsp. narinosa]
MRGPKDVRCITTRGRREGPNRIQCKKMRRMSLGLVLNVFLTLSPTLNEAACYNLGSWLLVHSLSFLWSLFGSFLKQFIGEQN